MSILGIITVSAISSALSSSAVLFLLARSLDRQLASRRRVQR